MNRGKKRWQKAEYSWEVSDINCCSWVPDDEYFGNDGRWDRERSDGATHNNDYQYMLFGDVL